VIESEGGGDETILLGGDLWCWGEGEGSTHEKAVFTRGRKERLLGTTNRLRRGKGAPDPQGRSGRVSDYRKGGQRGPPELKEEEKQKPRVEKENAREISSEGGLEDTRGLAGSIVLRHFPRDWEKGS